MNKLIKGKEYSVEETKRRYVFVGKDIELEGVKEIVVSHSGNHRIKTADGKLHIIPPTWIHIEITSDRDWVF